MTEVFFTFIVPCYNVQDYLEKCVNSLLAQTYKNFEVVLIDDGSTDSTPEICNHFASLDNRVRVFHKSNGGLSDARNYGMQKANGDYYVFVDSDDFIFDSALNNFSRLVSKSEPDVLLTKLSNYYDSTNIVEEDCDMKKYFEKGVTLDKALHWEMCVSQSAWPAQKKIISSNFIKRHNLQFLKGFLHEDVDWSSHVMMFAETFEICSEPWYFHRMEREGSITNTISSKRITDVIEMSANLIQGKEMKSISENRQELISERVMRSVYSTLSLYSQLSRDGEKKVVSCCNTNRELFSLAPEPRHRIFSLCAKIFGFHFALNILAKVGGVV